MNQFRKDSVDGRLFEAYAYLEEGRAVEAFKKTSLYKQHIDDYLDHGLQDDFEDWHSPDCEARTGEFYDFKGVIKTFRDWCETFNLEYHNADNIFLKGDLYDFLEKVQEVDDARVDWAQKYLDKYYAGKKEPTEPREIVNWLNENINHPGIRAYLMGDVYKARPDLLKDDEDSDCVSEPYIIAIMDHMGYESEALGGVYLIDPKEHPLKAIWQTYPEEPPVGLQNIADHINKEHPYPVPIPKEPRHIDCLELHIIGLQSTQQERALTAVESYELDMLEAIYRKADGRDYLQIIKAAANVQKICVDQMNETLDKWNIFD